MNKGCGRAKHSGSALYLREPLHRIDPVLVRFINAQTTWGTSPVRKCDTDSAINQMIQSLGLTALRHLKPINKRRRGPPNHCRSEVPERGGGRLSPPLD